MIEIRPMGRPDLIDVVAIERLCFGDRWNVASFTNELDNPSSHYFTITDGEKIVGYCGYWLILDEAHVTTIAVHPSQQKRSLGEALLLHMVRHCERQGAKWLTLEVRVSNRSAQRLYEKYGFTSLGRRKGYYQDDGEDALVMWTENIWQADYRSRLERLAEALHARLPVQVGEAR